LGDHAVTGRHDLTKQEEEAEKKVPTSALSVSQVACFALASRCENGPSVNRGRHAEAVLACVRPQTHHDSWLVSHRTDRPEQKKQFADYRLGTSGRRAMNASAMRALSLLQARLIDLNLLLKVKQRS
jgi:hypothetical protein